MSSGHGCFPATPPRSLERIATHYDVLGVPPSASAAVIRAAYRERARRFHPDRSAGDAASMAAVNEAYRILGDADRRRHYDRTLAAPGARTSARPGVHVDDPDDIEEFWTASRPRLAATGGAQVPWKGLGIAGVVGAAAILIGAAFTDPPAEETPDGILRGGSCVEIEANGDAREVTCTGEDDIVVEVLVPTEGVCPAGTEPHRDRLGLGTACIVR